MRAPHLKDDRTATGTARAGSALTIAFIAALGVSLVASDAVTQQRKIDNSKSAGAPPPAAPSQPPSGEEAASVPMIEQDLMEALGLRLEEVGSDRGLVFPAGGYVAGVKRGSPAEGAGLRVGDVIIQADRITVPTAAALARILAARRTTAAPGDVATLRFIRGGATLSGKLELLPVTQDTPPAAERPAPQSQAAEQPEAAPEPLPPRRSDRSLAVPPLLMVDGGGHAGLVGDLIFHPDGERLISASDDKTIRVWNWRTGELIQVIRGPSAVEGGEIYALALSPDGRTLAAGGLLDLQYPFCCMVRLIDLQTGELLGAIEGQRDAVTDLAFSPDGRHLVSAGTEGDAIIYDLESRSKRHILRGHEARLYGAAFSPDGARVVTISYDRSLRIWDVETGAQIGAPLLGHKDRVRSLAISSTGLVASGDVSGDILLWDVYTGAAKGVLTNTGGNVVSLAFSPDGERIVATCGSIGCSTTQYVYDIATGQRITQQAAQDNTVMSAAWSDDGVIATGGGLNMEILLWDGQNGASRGAGKLQGVGGRTETVAFSKDGLRIGWNFLGDGRVYQPVAFALTLPSGSSGGLGPVSTDIVAEDFEAPAERGDGIEYRVETGGPYYHPRGALVIYRQGSDGAEQVLGRIERSVSDGQSHSAVTWGPGDRIISGGASGFLISYDLQGNETGRFVGHFGQVWGLALSPDGRFLISGGDDQTVRLWSVETYELLVTIFPGADGSYIAWTPQGYYDYYAASGAERPDGRIGWLLNYGPDLTPDFVTARQLGPILYQPELLARAVQLGSAEQAIAEAIAAQEAAPSGRAPLPKSVDELLTAPVEAN